MKTGHQVGKTGGGKFDPLKRNLYFIAAQTLDMEIAIKYHKHCLIAVNELETPQAESMFKDFIDKEITLFLDSGVYNLASEHARRHGVSHDVALRTPLDQIDGFNELYYRYLRLVKEHETNLWGYVEIDIGGIEQKRKTRAELERLGLRPIPVYHPLNDGWDYFDELASKYDRICVGNVVQASRYVRKRIMATVWERKRKKYPNLWIHLLGMTPNEWSNAYPLDSMDSSTWLAGVRWPDAWREKAALQSVSGFSKQYVYVLGDHESWYHAKECAAFQQAMNEKNWNNHLQSLKETGENDAS